MRVETRRALLLIADIGGYTEYMQYHRTLLGHAEAATRRLLEKVVDAARGFDLIEIEGDAAFLSRGADTLDGGSGNDRLFAGYGDNVDGGEGNDSLFVSFLAATSGVYADFNQATLQGHRHDC